MELALQILLGLVTLICLAGGLNLLIKGANSFLRNQFQPSHDTYHQFLDIMALNGSIDAPKK